MARQLRGQRYLDSTKNKALATTLIDKLPFYDYEQTIDWYKRAVPKLDDAGKALLGCNDRYFLLTNLLKRSDALHPWVFDRCREVESAPDGYLDLWARGHFKSSLISCVGVIQELMADPEITIAIFSHTKPIAAAFLHQIKREFEENTELKKIYSDVLWENPKTEAAIWSREGIIIKRKSNPKEASVEAHGLVDGQPVSRHYDLLVYDDIVTEKAVTNPIQIKKTTLAWENSDNLSKANKVRKQMAGTRWHWGDTYGVILESGALKPRIYPATEDGTMKGKPVFLTQEKLDDVKKTQRSTFSAQMLLNPVAGNDAVFQTEWFQSYEIFPTVLNVYILCDPSKGKRRAARGGDSDRTAIAVVGIDPGGNKFLLDGYRHRMSLSQRYDFITQLHRKWSSHPGVQFVRVGYEQYGAQVDIEVIQEYQLRDNSFFEVEELNFPREGQHSKKDRVERLEPDMRSGRFYLPAVVWHPTIGDIKDPQQDHTCLWHVWSDEDVAKCELEGKKNPHNVGQIIYRTMRGLTKNQRYCENTAQRHRIVRAIRRIDEEGDLYDLTRAFMEEARSFPYAPHDDLIDAVSRIYDLEPSRPEQYESESVEGIYEDMIGGAQDQVATGE